MQAEAQAALGSVDCLIGYHSGSSSKSWVALPASSCFIGDNQRYCELFEPLIAPEDEELKGLYTFLGARTLSEAVAVEARPGT